jgi:hypothetical protein|tara:strand:- start:281 stop:424 length:144 start_codon:yes stop_codon:yes gene_type:complete
LVIIRVVERRLKILVSEHLRCRRPMLMLVLKAEFNKTLRFLVDNRLK